MSERKSGGGVSGSKPTALVEGEYPGTDGEQPGQLVADRPRLALTFGRGNRGKTTLVRFLYERALMHGRSVMLADGDRTNQTLASYYSGAGVVDSPPSTHDFEMRDWIDRLIDRQAELGDGLILDLGGGDMVIKRMAEEMSLVAALDEAGIDPVALHLIGTDPDDLAYLQAVLPEAAGAEGAFAPERTVLVFNQGLMTNGQTDALVAFRAVRDHPIVLRAIKLGARVVLMPQLNCMQELVSKRACFMPAMTRGESPLGVMNRQRVSFWWKEMEHAFAPVAGWLP